MKYDAQRLIQEYSKAYEKPHHFGHQTLFERPFLKALAKKAKLPEAASVLDAGCGQGFFSSLFAEQGFKALGVDLSSEGIASARKEYASSGASFEVGDILSLPYVETFDCVFARGLSLYNTDEFETDRQVTDALLRYVRPGGVFIFVHYTVLNHQKKSATFIYHSGASVKRHFAGYANTSVYFSNRSDTRRFGAFAFCAPVSAINRLISRSTGMGVYPVVLVRKAQEPAGMTTRNS